MSATSSNTVLVPNGNIVLGGSRRDSHGHGDAGGESVGHGDDYRHGQRRHAERHRSFIVTVTAVNDAPTMTRDRQRHDE